MTENRPEPRSPTDLSVAQIEQLVEAQARGEATLVGGLPIEQATLPQAELDTRYARHSFAAAALLEASAADSQPGQEDATSDSTPPQALDSPVDQSPEDGHAVPGTQDVDQPEITVSPDAVTPTDDGLGLIFRHNEG